MPEQDEKKPPVGGSDEVGKIEISLLANGGARMVATCGGKPDCSYGVMPDRRLPVELAMLLGELRARLAISRCLSPDKSR